MKQKSDSKPCINNEKSSNLGGLMKSDSVNRKSAFLYSAAA